MYRYDDAVVNHHDIAKLSDQSYEKFTYEVNEVEFLVDSCEVMSKLLKDTYSTT